LERPNILQRILATESGVVKKVYFPQEQLITEEQEPQTQSSDITSSADINI